MRNVKSKVLYSAVFLLGLSLIIVASYGDTLMKDDNLSAVINTSSVANKVITKNSVIKDSTNTVNRTTNSNTQFPAGSIVVDFNKDSLNKFNNLPFVGYSTKQAINEAYSKNNQQGWNSILFIPDDLDKNNQLGVKDFNVFASSNNCVKDLGKISVAELRGSNINQSTGYTEKPSFLTNIFPVGTGVSSTPLFDEVKKIGSCVPHTLALSFRKAIEYHKLDPGYQTVYEDGSIYDNFIETILGLTKFGLFFTDDEILDAHSDIQIDKNNKYKFSCRWMYSKKNQSYEMIKRQIEKELKDPLNMEKNDYSLNSVYETSDGTAIFHLEIITNIEINSIGEIIITTQDTSLKPEWIHLPGLGQSDDRIIIIKPDGTVITQGSRYPITEWSLSDIGSLLRILKCEVVKDRRLGFMENFGKK